MYSRAIGTALGALQSILLQGRDNKIFGHTYIERGLGHLTDRHRTTTSTGYHGTDSILWWDTVQNSEHVPSFRR